VGGWSLGFGDREVGGGGRVGVILLPSKVGGARRSVAGDWVGVGEGGGVYWGKLRGWSGGGRIAGGVRFYFLGMLWDGRLVRYSKIWREWQTSGQARARKTKCLKPGRPP